MTIESKKMNTKITKHEKKARVAQKHKKLNIQFERRAGGFSLFIGSSMQIY